MPAKNKFNLFIGLYGLTSFLMLSTCYAVEQQEDNVTVIKPSKKVEKVESAEIDTEKFELGLFAGYLSVADFGTNSLTGFEASYHINSDFIAQLRIGQSDIKRATFEAVIGLDFLSEKDREFKFTQVSAGYQLYSGRSFVDAKNRFSTHLYVTAGLENIRFAGNDDTGYVLGVSYKVVPMDWLTITLNLQDHLFDRAFLGDDKLTNNVEFSVSFNALF